MLPNNDRKTTGNEPLTRRILPRKAVIGGLMVLVAAALLGGLGLVMVQPSDAQVVIKAPGAKPVANNAPKAILVHADEELSGYLTEAEALLEGKQYDEAIKILQALIMMPDGGYVNSSSTPGLFIGLRLRASAALGKLDATGIERYRMMFDTVARDLYNEGLAGDLAKFRTVATCYPPSTYGPMAVQRLGALYFDQGRFAQAALIWKQLLTRPQPDPERPVVLARLAITCHLAGDEVEAKKFFDELKAKHGTAQADMGGQSQVLADYVAKAMTIKSSDIVTGSSRDVLTGGWPGLGGNPTGTGLMDDSHVLLEPRWTVGANGADHIDPAALRENMIALSELFNTQMFRQQGNTVRVDLEKGHVQVRPTFQNNTNTPFTLPPAVEPVVVGDEIIYRTTNSVVAVDIVTGRVIWQTGGPNSQDMKMERDLPAGMPYYGYNQGMQFLDVGRYRITVGNNRIYTVSNFRPYMNSNEIQNFQRGPNIDKNALADTSRLIAIQIDPANTTSADRQGKRIWMVGMGEGDSDVVRGGKFLSAPTYKNGYLYVIVEYIDAYHLVCLDAEKGKTVWETTISQVPTMQGFNPWGGYQNDNTDRCGPPAVADGRVFVSTNAGVVAAVEADTGLPVWAYQYPVASQNAMNPGNPGMFRVSPTSAVNPLIVSGGRVVALPCDSINMLCLSTETGEPVFSPINRRNLNDLSYIDDKRVLLSGDSLMVVDIVSGKELWPADTGAPTNLGIMGRPAVSSQAVLASGRDRIVRMSLSDYKVTFAEAKNPDGLLGNLVCLKDKLIAANTVGLCAYFNYDEAFRQLTARMNAAKGADRGDMLFQRARLSFSDARFDVCVTDLHECVRLAKEAKDDAQAAKIQPWFYRSYVGAANKALKGPEMLANFKKAGEFATTDQERAYLSLRIAKCHLKNEDLKQALAQAQDLSEKQPQEMLVDIAIGEEADDAVRTTPAMPEKLAATLAQDFIAAIVKTAPGRAAYEAFDTQAKSELDKARSAHDVAALEKLAQRWPNSLHAEPALYLAAEEYCLQLAKLQGDPDKAREILGKVYANLSRVIHDNSDLSTRASLALAMVGSRWGNCADLALYNIDDQVKAMGSQEFAFADYKGTVKDLLAQISRNAGTSEVATAGKSVAVAPQTYEKAYDLKDQNTFILTDQDYQPVRLMDQVLALKDRKLVLVDTQAKDADNAIRWWGMSTVAMGSLNNTGYSIPGTSVVAALSKDGKLVCVADRESVSGVAISSAKILWQKKFTTDLLISSPQMFSMGEGVLIVNDTGSGKVICVDLSTGEIAWQSQLASQFRNLVQPICIRNGLAMAISAAGRGLVCWNIKTGKIVASIEARQSVVGRLTPRGMLVTLIDGQLNVRDPKDLSKELWPNSPSYPGGDILAATDTTVLAASGQKTGVLDVLSIPQGGAVLGQMTMGMQSGATVTPCSVELVKDRAYVTCFRAPATGFPRYGQMPTGRGLSVQAFDLKDFKQLWQADLDVDNDHAYIMLPTRVAGDAVVVSPASMVPAAQPYQAQQSNQARVFVVSASTGKVVTQLSPEMETAEAGRRVWSPPVVTNERLLMETADGLRVVGKR